jgi:hypothetical protein
MSTTSTEQGTNPLESQADASAGGWFDCTVNYAGPAEDGVIYIHLHERSGVFNKWFKATEVCKREMLATALTAITSGLPVAAALATQDEYGVLERLYVHT